MSFEPVSKQAYARGSAVVSCHVLCGTAIENTSSTLLGLGGSNSFNKIPDIAALRVGFQQRQALCCGRAGSSPQPLICRNVALACYSLPPLFLCFDSGIFLSQLITMLAYISIVFYRLHLSPAISYNQRIFNALHSIFVQHFTTKLQTWPNL